MRTMYIMRGLPGSGKSTIARSLRSPISPRSPFRPTICSADAYMLDERGHYCFDAGLLPEAHANCKRDAEVATNYGRDVVVDNTNIQRWMFQPYLELAEREDYAVVVVDVYDGGLSDEALALRNVHGCPQETIARMRARYEHDWRLGSRTPTRTGRISSTSPMAFES